jgi:hypothetical protein
MPPRASARPHVTALFLTAALLLQGAAAAAAPQAPRGAAREIGVPATPGEQLAVLPERSDLALGAAPARERLPLPARRVRPLLQTPSAVRPRGRALPVPHARSQTQRPRAHRSADDPPPH